MNAFMHRLKNIVKEIIINFIVFYLYLDLFVFYILYFLLYLDYGKKPDDDILVTKSYYYQFFGIYQRIGDTIGNYVIILGIFLIILRIFGINLISKKQIILFIGGYILLFILMGIDPFGAFDWSYFS